MVKNMNVLEQLENEHYRMDLPQFRSGDTVKVHVRIVEGNRERVQVFEGLVIAINRKGARTSFTVRKVSYGIGVERVFPLHSPMLDRIDVVNRGQVRRSKLYYIRKLKGKAARIKERMYRPQSG
jgi:large subunit ribosomal protein L19